MDYLTYIIGCNKAENYHKPISILVTIAYLYFCVCYLSSQLIELDGEQYLLQFFL